jgi:hypothetical protein
MQSRLGRQRQLFELLAGSRVRVVSKLSLPNREYDGEDYPRR